jgi:hypothetical protein
MTAASGQGSGYLGTRGRETYFSLLPFSTQAIALCATMAYSKINKQTEYSFSNEAVELCKCDGDMNNKRRNGWGTGRRQRWEGNVSKLQSSSKNLHCLKGRWRETVKFFITQGFKNVGLGPGEDKHRRVPHSHGIPVFQLCYLPICTCM